MALRCFNSLSCTFKLIYGTGIPLNIVHFTCPLLNFLQRKSAKKQIEPKFYTTYQ